MSPVSEAGLFLIDTLFSLIVFVFMMRYLLERVNVDIHNPLSQFVMKVTAPILSPLERMLPKVRRHNVACLVALIVIEMLRHVLTMLIFRSTMPGLIGVLIWSLGSLITLAINIYFFAILIQIVLSWIQPRTYNPIISIIHRITDPIMLPFKRWVPPMGGLDISPIFALLALQLANIIIAKPVVSMGIAMALG